MGPRSASSPTSKTSWAGTTACQASVTQPNFAVFSDDRRSERTALVEPRDHRPCVDNAVDAG
jgi:hypothetical protein